MVRGSHDAAILATQQLPAFFTIFSGLSPDIPVPTRPRLKSTKTGPRTPGMVTPHGSGFGDGGKGEFCQCEDFAHNAGYTVAAEVCVWRSLRCSMARPSQPLPSPIPNLQRLPNFRDKHSAVAANPHCFWYGGFPEVRPDKFGDCHCL